MKSWFPIAALAWILIARVGAAQEESDDFKRTTVYPPPYLNRYHPDWPAKTFGFDALGKDPVPYYPAYVRTRYKSDNFHPLFDRRTPFSRRERWPYRRR